MYFPQKHCERILRELDYLRISKSIDINEIRYVKGDIKGREKTPFDDNDLIEYVPGAPWGTDRENYLFRAKFKVPEKLEGATLMLAVETSEYSNTNRPDRFVREKWNLHKNPQFVLYINGEPWQGIDKFHTYSVITHNAVKDETFDIALDGFPGMAEGNLQLFLKIDVLDTRTDRLYFNLKSPLEVSARLDDNKLASDILGYLETTVGKLDLRKAYTPEYYASIKEANEYIEGEFYDKYCGKSDAVVSGIGHTHIDVAWLWPLSQTRQKTIRSFSTVLRLMEDYPEYLFMSSQPQLYDFIRKDRPEIYEKIKQKVSEGVWEPEGGMWLEADCNVTSGESFVRQILFGKRFFLDEFNVDCKILWLPDVFGYSAALPQILKKSGMKYFMTTKIFWNEYNRFPYETFNWEGIDGSTVLSHFITTTDMSEKGKTYGSTYNGRLSTPHVMGAWENYSQKGLNNDVLMAFGYGDGGGGPTREMLEEGRRLSKGIPGAPKFQMKKSRDFFEQLEKRIGDDPMTPKWVGELYLEYHRGTYTSVGKNKWYNRKCELLLRDVELFCRIAYSYGVIDEYPGREINSNWETVLLNQFHDILPGSSIKEVYEESQVQYADVMKAMNLKLGHVLDKLAAAAADDGKCVVFNQLSHDRMSLAKVSTDETYTHAVSQSGEKIPGQTVVGKDGRYFVFGALVPPMSLSTFSLENNQAEAGGMYAGRDGMENDFLKITFDENMNMVSIHDKCNDRELVKPGERANRLIAFEDRPIDWDAWDINIYYNNKKWYIDDVESVEVVENGPVRTGVKIRRRFLDSTIEQTIYMYSFSRRIDFKTHIDWRNDHILLKASFPMDIHANSANYEIQYGNVERPTHWNTSWDYARFEVAAHKWADISESDYGVALMNDCKYGHDIRGSVMRLTLLKSATLPNPVADFGEHEIVYSIMPHSGDFKSGGTIAEAYDLNCPLHSVVASGGNRKLDGGISYVSVDKANVVIEAVKSTEDGDGIIVRLYECHNSRSTVRLRFAKKLKTVHECDLLENNENEIEPQGDEFTFEIKPYEIKTFKLTH